MSTATPDQVTKETGGPSEQERRTPAYADKINKLSSKYQTAVTKRSTLNVELQQIQKFVRPTTPRPMSFSATTLIGNRQKFTEIYDTTAVRSAENLNAGLFSYATSPVEKYRKLSVRGVPMSQLTPLQKEALTEAEDIMDEQCNDPDSGWFTMLNEYYLELVTGGTSIPFARWHEGYKMPRWNIFPLNTTYVDENFDGIVDTVHVRGKFYARQLMQKFANCPVEITKANDTTAFELILSVFPRDDSNPDVPVDTNQPWASFWWLNQPQIILKESGYEQFPFFPTRWEKFPGEVYGISPAMNALPTIRNVNQIMRDTLVASALMVRPPWLVDNDSIIPPFTLEPGAIINSQPNSREPKSLGPVGDLQYADNLLAELKDEIRQFFYLDWLLRGRKNERQTAFEVSDERDEMLRQLAPILVRLQSEGLTRMTRWHFNELRRRDKLPKWKKAFGDDAMTVNVSYIGPAARAQSGTKATNIQRFLQDIVPILQLDQSAADYIPLDKIVKTYAACRDVDGLGIPRSDDEVAKLRRDRAKQQQAAQATEAAPQLASAMRDVAAAKKDGLNLPI